MVEYLPWLFIIVGILVLIYYGYARSISYRDQDFLTKEKYIPTQSNENVYPNGPIFIGDKDFLKKEKCISIPSSKEGPRSKLPVGHIWMPMIISIIVLVSALFVILSKNAYGETQQKWAIGVIGTIIGYWLKK